MIENLFTRIGLWINLRSIKKKSRVTSSAYQICVLTHALDVTHIVAARNIFGNKEYWTVMSLFLLFLFQRVTFTYPDNICYVTNTTLKSFKLNIRTKLAVSAWGCYVE